MVWRNPRSTRRPSDWDARRAECRRLARDRCQAPVHEPGCSGVGAECDHIIPNDDHSQANLQWLSEPCHAAKTKREAAAGRAAMNAKAKHPVERHPDAPRR